MVLNHHGNHRHHHSNHGNHQGNHDNHHSNHGNDHGSHGNHHVNHDNHHGDHGNHCNHQVNFSDTIPLRLLVIFRWEPAFLTLLSQDRVLVGKKMSECQTKAVLKNLKT